MAKSFQTFLESANAKFLLKGEKQVREEGETETHPYHVIDRHTKTVVAKHKDKKRARTSVDKRDNAYGAYRYHVHDTTIHGPYKPQHNEELQEFVIHHLPKIASSNVDKPLRFSDGSTCRVDKLTAQAILAVHARCNDENKAALELKMEKSAGHFKEIAGFAHGVTTAGDIVSPAKKPKKKKAKKK